MKNKNVIGQMLAGIQPSLIEKCTMEMSMPPDKMPTGVSWCKRKRRFRAYLHQGRTQVYHGYFDTIPDAVVARKKAELKYGESVKQVSGKRPRPADRKVVVPRRRLLGVLIRDIEDSTYVVMETAQAVQAKSMRGREQKRGPSYRTLLGERIGRLVASIDALVLSGEVRHEDIEAGLKDRVMEYREQEKSYS